MTKPNYKPNTGHNSNPYANPNIKQTLILIQVHNFHPNPFQNPQICTSAFYQWPSPSAQGMRVSATVKKQWMQNVANILVSLRMNKFNTLLLSTSIQSLFLILKCSESLILLSNLK